MKNSNTFKKQTLMLIGASFIGLTTFTSCGSIHGAITGGKRPLFLVNAPNNVVVSVDGIKQDITSELFAVNSGIGDYATTTSYYTSAIKIPYKKPATLEISSGNRTGTVSLTTKRSSGIFWANVFIAPIVGHIVDAVTGNNKVLHPKYIDVESVLNKVPLKDWPNQGKLKRVEKRKIKKG